MAERRRRRNDEPMDPEEFQRREAARERAEAPRPPAYQVADGVREIADAQIGDRHVHLRDVGIVYVWRGTERKRRGRVIGGVTLKLNDWARFLESGKEGVEMGAQFAVLLDKGTWDRATAPRVREAIVDERLCQIVEKTDTDGNTTLALRDPDEYYAENVSVFGAWKPELETGRKVFGQLPLPLTRVS